MTTTLLRRVERLEVVIPPPPPPATDDDGAWWDGLPAAVVRYVLALAEECAAHELDPNSPAGGAWIHARHPLLSRILTIAHERHRLGDAPPLTEYQRHMLHRAWQILHRQAADIRLAAGGAKNHPESADRAAWTRLLGTDDAAGVRAGAIYGARSGAFSAQWQASGTTDPETLMLVGFHAAELALLGAEE